MSKASGMEPSSARKGKPKQIKETRQSLPTHCYTPTRETNTCLWIFKDEYERVVPNHIAVGFQRKKV
jgi:hypothetical protein